MGMQSGSELIEKNLNNWTISHRPLSFSAPAASAAAAGRMADLIPRLALGWYRLSLSRLPSDDRIPIFPQRLAHEFEPAAQLHPVRP